MATVLSAFSLLRSWSSPRKASLVVIDGPATAHPPQGQGSLARSPMPIVRPAGAILSSPALGVRFCRLHSKSSKRRRRTPLSPRLPCVTTCLPVSVCSLASVPRLCRVPCPRELILISPRAPSLSEDRATAKLLSTAGGREKIHVVLLHARPRAGESGQESGNRNTAERLEHLCGLAISEMFARYRCLLL